MNKASREIHSANRRFEFMFPRTEERFSEDRYSKKRKPTLDHEDSNNYEVACRYVLKKGRLVIEKVE